MTLDIWHADADTVTTHDGADWQGAPRLSVFTHCEVTAALAHIARTQTDRARMFTNGSPVLLEADLIVMREAMAAARHNPEPLP